MNISELFIRRPVMTTLLMAAFLVFGIIAYRALPVSELPNVDFPTINVSANLPGASPETMAAAVATPAAAGPCCQVTSRLGAYSWRITYLTYSSSAPVRPPMA